MAHHNVSGWTLTDTLSFLLMIVEPNIERSVQDKGVYDGTSDHHDHVCDIT